MPKLKNLIANTRYIADEYVKLQHGHLQLQRDHDDQTQRMAELVPLAESTNWLSEYEFNNLEFVHDIKGELIEAVATYPLTNYIHEPSPPHICIQNIKTNTIMEPGEVSRRVCDLKAAGDSMLETEQRLREICRTGLGRTPERRNEYQTNLDSSLEGLVGRIAPAIQSFEDLVAGCNGILQKKVQEAEEASNAAKAEGEEYNRLCGELKASETKVTEGLKVLALG